jgi:hypothetical protein
VNKRIQRLQKRGRNGTRPRNNEKQRAQGD